MAKEARIDVAIGGDSTGLRRELDVSRNEVTRFARDVTSRLSAIAAATQSINVLGQVRAIMEIGKQAVETWKIISNWFQGIGKVSEEASRAAAKLADNLEKGAKNAGAIYLNLAQGREEREQDEKDLGKARKEGVQKMIGDLVNKDIPIEEVTAAIAESLGGDMSKIPSIVEAVQMRLRRNVFGQMRDITEFGFSAELKKAFNAYNARQMAETPNQGAVSQGLYNWAKNGVLSAIEYAKKAKEAYDAAQAAEARRNEKIAAVEEKRVKAEKTASDAIEAVRVAAPGAINSVNASGGLLGLDPTALNRDRMEAERNAKVAAIEAKLGEALRALDEEIRILRGD